jgi:hypothetical protein
MLGKTLVPLLVIAPLMACYSPTALSSNYTGNYAGSATTAGDTCGTGNLVLTLTQVGTVLTGSWTTSGFGGSNCPLYPYLNTTGYISGQASGSSLSMTLSPATGNYNTFSLLGTASATGISGSYTVNNGDYTNGGFSLTKQ